MGFDPGRDMTLAQGRVTSGFYAPPYPGGPGLGYILLVFFIGRFGAFLRKGYLSGWPCSQGGQLKYVPDTLEDFRAQSVSVLMLAELHIVL